MKDLLICSLTWLFCCVWGPILKEDTELSFSLLWLACLWWSMQLLIPSWWSVYNNWSFYFSGHLTGIELVLLGLVGCSFLICSYGLILEKRNKICVVLWSRRSGSPGCISSLTNFKTTIHLWAVSFLISGHFTGLIASLAINSFGLCYLIPPSSWFTDCELQCPLIRAISKETNIININIDFHIFGFGSIWYPLKMF